MMISGSKQMYTILRDCNMRALFCKWLIKKIYYYYTSLSEEGSYSGLKS